jgi:hypothetical protein
MVYSPSTDFRDIKQAVHAGRIYASTGLVLGSLSLDGGVIRISLDYGKINYNEIVLSFIGENSVVLFQTKGWQGEYRLEGKEKYVRVHAKADSGAQLWTQPVYNDQYLSH